MTVSTRLETTRRPNPLDRVEHLLSRCLANVPLARIGGTVVEVTPGIVRAKGLSAFVRLGECVRLGDSSGEFLTEVVRIDESETSLKPFETLQSIGIGAAAWHSGPILVAPEPSWKGRIVNALGEPIDGAGPLARGATIHTVDRAAPPAMRRQAMQGPVRTGVRVIDLFTPLCGGQRMGIFAGSGVGKSTLLAMMSRAAGFDAVVIALVGERGREVREFLLDSLGADRSRMVAVVATGDESPSMRRLAPRTAMTIAESFRDRGDNVLIVVDSITRFAHAAREIALAAGEPPVARGYPPSVFSDLPKLLERAGPGAEGPGSITGLFTVLVDGDDHNDPVADAIRGTLDGHIVLDRAIADQARWPAVNVLGSISRLAHRAWTGDQRKLVAALRAMIDRYEDTRDLRMMGGYQPGSDAELDRAIKAVPLLYEALKQAPDDPASSDVFRDVATLLSGALGAP